MRHDIDDCWQLKNEIEFLIKKRENSPESQNMETRIMLIERKKYQGDRDKKSERKEPVINIIF